MKELEDLDKLNPLGMDPWSYEEYLADLEPHIERLKAVHRTREGAVWILGNGPSLVTAAPVILQSPIPKIGVNKALGVVWPLDATVICHTEHLEEPVPGFLDLETTKARWSALEQAGGLYLHGTSHLDRGTAIQVSHDHLFSRDLVKGASEGLAETGGSVMLVAMQLAYWLGFREFFMAGFELMGEKFYPGGPYSPGALDGQVRLFEQVAPELMKAGVQAWLVGVPKESPNRWFFCLSLDTVEKSER